MADKYEKLSFRVDTGTTQTLKDQFSLPDNQSRFKSFSEFLKYRIMQQENNYPTTNLAPVYTEEQMKEEIRKFKASPINNYSPYPTPPDSPYLEEVCEFTLQHLKRYRKLDSLIERKHITLDQLDALLDHAEINPPKDSDEQYSQERYRKGRR